MKGTETPAIANGSSRSSAAGLSRNDSTAAAAIPNGPAGRALPTMGAHASAVVMSLWRLHA
jgi:hypothetical protein